MKSSFILSDLNIFFLNIFFDLVSLHLLKVLLLIKEFCLFKKYYLIIDERELKGIVIEEKGKGDCKETAEELMCYIDSETVTADDSFKHDDTVHYHYESELFKFPFFLYLIGFFPHQKEVGNKL